MPRERHIARIVAQQSPTEEVSEEAFCILKYQFCYCSFLERTLRPLI